LLIRFWNLNFRFKKSKRFEYIIWSNSQKIKKKYNHTKSNALIKNSVFLIYKYYFLKERQIYFKSFHSLKVTHRYLHSSLPNLFLYFNYNNNLEKWYLIDIHSRFISDPRTPNPDPLSLIPEPRPLNPEPRLPSTEPRPLNPIP